MKNVSASRSMPESTSHIGPRNIARRWILYLKSSWNKRLFTRYEDEPATLVHCPGPAWCAVSRLIQSQPDISKRRYAAVFDDDSIDGNVPSWQRAAPKAALYVTKNAPDSGADSDKEPYPKKFDEIIAFLQTGKEIPGIVQIPDTVIDDPVSSNQELLIRWVKGREFCDH